LPANRSTSVTRKRHKASKEICERYEYAIDNKNEQEISGVGMGSRSGPSGGMGGGYPELGCCATVLLRADWHYWKIGGTSWEGMRGEGGKRKKRKKERPFQAGNYHSIPNEGFRLDANGQEDFDRETK